MGDYKNNNLVLRNSSQQLQTDRRNERRIVSRELAAADDIGCYRVDAAQHCQARGANEQRSEFTRHRLHRRQHLLLNVHFFFWL